jgi:hypothetical protein
MKQIYCALVVGLGLAATYANAGCEYPTAPGKFPDGATAPIADLKVAKAEVEKYNADIDVYLTCLTDEYKANAESEGKLTNAQKKDAERMLKQKQQAAIKESDDVTERMNVQVRAYGVAHPKPKKD